MMIDDVRREGNAAARISLRVRHHDPGNRYDRGTIAADPADISLTRGKLDLALLYKLEINRRSRRVIKSIWRGYSMIRRHEMKRGGFTLVEVLIVVVILGILAATVLPQFTRADSDAKETALMQNLQTLRSQIELYKFQHLSKYPADGTTNSTVFRDSLVLSSDPDGTTGAIGAKPLGPYFIGELPANPYNGLRTITVVLTDPLPLADDSSGWIYSSASGRIKANIAGTLSSDGVTKLEDL